MSNPVIETIMNRRSIRAFKQEQLSDDQLDILKKVALISPTASNMQNFHFSVIQNKDLIADFETDIVDYFVESGSHETVERIKSRNNKIIYDAPTLIVISCLESYFAKVDGGIAVQSLALSAKSLGLESVILGLPKAAFEGKDCKKWEKAFEFPEGYKFVIAIAIGYGDMDGKDRELDTSKLTVIK